MSVKTSGTLATTAGSITTNLSFLDVSDTAPPVVALKRVVFIDPTAAFGGDGSQAHPFRNIASVSVRAGDVILFKGGTVSAGFTVSVAATATNPVIIGSYGTGAAQITGTVLLDGANHVTVTGLDVSGGGGPGVMLTGGTANSTVQANLIHGGLVGVYVDDGSALGNAVLNNQVYENDTAGIWLNGVSAAAGQEFTISANTVYRNGQQGISLNASYVDVNGNTVVNNGLSGLAGASAIHVYGVSATEPSTNDVITNNVVADQRDSSSLDGNGIQLDHWTSSNTLSGNTIFGNAGSGISLYSSGDNTVIGNLLAGNDVDPGGSRDDFAVNTEIFLGEADFAPGTTVGNVITGNTIVASGRDTLAFQVLAPVALAANSIGGNQISVAAGLPLWQVGTTTGTSLADWNTQASLGGDDTVLPAAAFSAAALPSFSAAMLSTTYTLHSTDLTTVSPTAANVLVVTPGHPNVTGGSGTNWIAGDANANILTGGPSADEISGGDGDDTIRGGGGNDELFGGAGNDMLFLTGGSGTAIGGDGNDLLFGGTGFSILEGGAGDDLLVGGGGDTVFLGGAGNDVFVPTTGSSVIMDFTSGQDRINLEALGVTSMSGFTREAGSTGTVLDIGAATVALPGVTASHLTAADFIFSTS